MSPIGPETVLLVFLLFCRIGGCLMLMPGFSSARVPAQVRLFIALAVTLALAPMLELSLRATLAKMPSVMILSLIVSEVVIGALIGVMGRIFFLALQFMATADATSRIHRAAEAGNAGAKELIGSPVGQIVGSMNSVRSVRDVMYSLVEEYVAVVEELHAGLAVPAKS